MQKTNNLQEVFLTQVRKQKIPVTLFLVNGFQLRGMITGFDCFVVVLDTEGKQQVIYKHAISTIAPLQKINRCTAAQQPAAACRGRQDTRGHITHRYIRSGT